MAIAKIGFYNIDLYSTYLPVLLVLMPPLLVKFIFSTEQSRNQQYWCGVGYLVGGAVSWVVSIYAPNLPVGRSESVTTHLMGGAFVVPFLLAYCKRRYLSEARTDAMYRALGLQFNPIIVRFAVLVACSCTFGVINELAEMTFAGAKIDAIVLDDAGSDLMANTVGTLVAFVAMEMWRFRARRRRARASV